MALDVYFQEDIYRGLVADVCLVMDTARVRDVLHEEYLRGVVSLALAQAMSYGISRREFIDCVKGELSIGDTILLESCL